MDYAKLRAWWASRQGWDGSQAECWAAEVLARSGWARSVGGVGPYLTLFSRAKLSRESVDAALAASAPLDLQPAEDGSDRFLLPDHVDDFRSLRMLRGRSTLW